MVTKTAKETLGFQTEVKQLLNLMIHSLYSNQEIFLRELISNASDAIDKLRFEGLKKPDLYEQDSTLKIQIEYDKKGKTLSISDNGIGMSRNETIDNIGTIAKSGTDQFLQKLTGDQKKDAALIGQFGVGFYSSFIVADQVELFTRRAGESKKNGVHWSSKGEGDFDIATCEKSERGTKIILHIKPEAEEFLDGFRLRTLIRKYSDHISVPIEMCKESSDQPEEKKEEDAKPADFEVINQATALWTRNRASIKDKEYTEFYHHISHDYTDPITWAHNHVEGKLEYSSLLYIPKRAPFDLYNRDMSRGLKLYVQRVFIMDDAEQFLPFYLRFVKGVIDSNDLSLNISREILQKNATVDSMRNALTKRVLDMLDKLAKKKPEDYKTFWKTFGSVLKEGVAEDFTNRARIAKLLRFATTEDNQAEQQHALANYMERMKKDQDKIYYICAESHQAANHSPHLEIFRKKGIEVLLLSDRIDEWLVSHLTEFEGKKFADVSRGTLDLGAMESEESIETQKKLSESTKDLVERISGILKDKVKEVRISQRLTDSPACLVVGEDDMGVQMRNIMKAAGQNVPEAKAILEINPTHKLIKMLETEKDSTRFGQWIEILFGQATLAEGGSLEDPGRYVQRLNNLLIGLTEKV